MTYDYLTAFQYNGQLYFSVSRGHSIAECPMGNPEYAVKKYGQLMSKYKLSEIHAILKTLPRHPTTATTDNGLIYYAVDGFEDVLQGSNSPYYFTNTNYAFVPAENLTCETLMDETKMYNLCLKVCNLYHNFATSIALITETGEFQFLHMKVCPDLDFISI